LNGSWNGAKAFADEMATYREALAVIASVAALAKGTTET
jgi:hypothetical protein